MKNYIKIAFVAAFAAIAGYGVYTSQKSEIMSDLALANVEALAGGETSGGGGADPNTFYGYKLTSCEKDGKRVGAICVQSQPGDECKRSSMWGKCD